MSTPKFDVTVKHRKRSRTVTISCGDKVIGQRTSPRSYRFALVVKRSQERALWLARECKTYQEKEAIRYEAGKVAPGFIADGSCARWAKQARESVEKCTRDIARLESGPQPEFDVMYIASWHQSRANVPKVKPYHVFVAVVEVPGE